MSDLKYYEGMKRQAETTVKGLEGNLNYLIGIREKTEAEIERVRWDVGAAKAHLAHIEETIGRLKLEENCVDDCAIGGVPGG